MLANKHKITAAKNKNFFRHTNETDLAWMSSFFLIFILSLEAIINHDFMLSSIDEFGFFSFISLKYFFAILTLSFFPFFVYKRIIKRKAGAKFAYNELFKSLLRSLASWSFIYSLVITIPLAFLALNSPNYTVLGALKGAAIFEALSFVLIYLFLSLISGAEMALFSVKNSRFLVVGLVLILTSLVSFRVLFSLLLKD